MDTETEMETENYETEGNADEEPCETGVYWTPELNIEFIRMRKSFGESSSFKRTRKKGSLSKEGWRQLILAMGLEGKLTPNQGKQRWNNFVNKYKYEKDPTRIGKPANTPITWPLFHMMDWAVGDRLEKKTCPANDEVPAAVASISMMEAGPSTSADESHQERRDIAMLIVRRHITQDGALPGISVRINPGRQVPLPNIPDMSPDMSPDTSSMSVRQRAARLIDAHEALIDNELNTIRSSLNDLTELQREKCESMRKNAEENMKTVNFIEKLVEASGRQARALERFTEILSQAELNDNNEKNGVSEVIIPN